MFKSWIVIELISDDEIPTNYTVVHVDEVNLKALDDIYEVKNSVGDVIAYTCESDSFDSLEAAKERAAVEEMMSKAYSRWGEIPEWLYELNTITSQKGLPNVRCLH